MKVGIVTITQGTNYGNRLQIYAVQQVLKKMGVESWLILNNTGVSGLLYNVKKIIKVLLNYKDERKIEKRERAFKKFDKMYLTIYDESLDESYSTSKIGQKFDAFICGSDQLWNPNYSRLNGIYFADFIDVKKRISYAASFGVDYIPETKREEYIRWLSNFDAISVREYSGKQIVENLTGKKATLLIDPTMMLDAKDWDKVSEKPSIFVPTRYIFCYFLGNVSDDVQTMIDTAKQRYNIDVINVLPKDKSRNYYLNPSNFVYLLSHCELVFTDSFHAVAFSILYRKQFRVFDRMDCMADMSSRVNTILEQFGLLKYNNNFNLNDTIEWPDYQKKILNEKRNEAYIYLKDALDPNGF